MRKTEWLHESRRRETPPAPPTLEGDGRPAKASVAFADDEPIGPSKPATGIAKVSDKKRRDSFADDDPPGPRKRTIPERIADDIAAGRWEGNCWLPSDFGWVDGDGVPAFDHLRQIIAGEWGAPSIADSLAFATRWNARARAQKITFKDSKAKKKKKKGEGPMGLQAMWDGYRDPISPPKRASPVRAIIAGGRDYLLTPQDFAWLDDLNEEFGPFAEVVSGCQQGADAGGEIWARRRGIPIARFPADWKRLGDSAGPIRNRAMAKHAAGGLCILFPGGSGTSNMRRVAERYGMTIKE